MPVADMRVAAMVALSAERTLAWRERRAVRVELGRPEPFVRALVDA